MATEQQELTRKVGTLIRTRFRGNYQDAFRHYDRLRTSTDGQIDIDELQALLEDAEVGNRLTRGAWARGVMGMLDTDRDGRISWQEFESVLTRR